jgi:glycosyltransferase involved in cell wall biosynthesis
LADTKGLRAYWPGYVPDSELAALLGGAELFIYPSRYEGFGIPPLLAMALGTPCVVSDAGALPEVVGDAAVSFPSGDAGALAERLETVARDPDPLAARSRLGKERAARFSVDLLAERMTRVYEAAAARREGSG